MEIQTDIETQFWTEFILDDISLPCHHHYNITMRQKIPESLSSLPVDSGQSQPGPSIAGVVVYALLIQLLSGCEITLK